MSEFNRIKENPLDRNARNRSNKSGRLKSALNNEGSKNAPKVTPIQKTEKNKTTNRFSFAYFTVFLKIWFNISLNIVFLPPCLSIVMSMKNKKALWHTICWYLKIVLYYLQYVSLILLALCKQLNKFKQNKQKNFDN